MPLVREAARGGLRAVSGGNASPSPLLYLERDMKEVEGTDLAGGRAVVVSLCSPIRDTPNEDGAALVPIDERSAVLAVADGLGGGAGGKQAARVALTSVAAALGRVATEKLRLRTAVLDGLEDGNLGVRALGIGAGTTFAAVCVIDDEVRPFQVGDSLILVAGGGGRVKWRTVSHSPVGYAVEAGVLDETEALMHEDRHLVSNFLGAPEMRIEIGPRLKLAKRDTVLLASDGLADNLSLEEIAEALKTRSLEEAVGALAREARRRMVEPGPERPSKPDDLTVVAFRRTAEGVAEAAKG